jgi:acyl-CoA synthetase (AMP-forming)/AMP-acid ligase II
MRGQMMGQPLLISSLLRHAETCHGDTEIVSRVIEPATGSSRFHRYGWTQLAQRARRLANALPRLGVAHGDRVGTLSWNGYRHVELYYAVSGSGSVIHTINPRLFPEQIVWMINHAEDRVIFFDINLAPLVEQLLPKCPAVKAWVAMTDAANRPTATIPGLLCYEDLLAAESDVYDWPLFDENEAACLCYTSGTTGNPKGVLYSHRSTLLHAYAAALPDVLNLSACDTALPVVPMFHVNAWGIPYAAALVGFKLVLPGNALDGASLCELFINEAVTFSAGVPTIWMALLQYLREQRIELPTLKRCSVGGSACPAALKDAFEDEYGIKLQSSWGMTETSPLGACNSPKAKHQELSAPERRRIELKAGRPAFGVELKVINAEGLELPRDGSSAGDLLVRGHWVVERYYKSDAPAVVDGWFPTGDVATLDADSYLTITDRSKDVIKSGGEWISSIELESVAMSHPAVAEAAVIGIVHPRWDERPLLVAVKRRDCDVGRDELLQHYGGRVAKWWIPDDVVFVEELPHTATGKVHKVVLREKFSAYRFSDVLLGS